MSFKMSSNQLNLGKQDIMSQEISIAKKLETENAMIRKIMLKYFCKIQNKNDLPEPLFASPLMC